MLPCAEDIGEPIGMFTGVFIVIFRFLIGTWVSDSDQFNITMAIPLSDSSKQASILNKHYSFYRQIQHTFYTTINRALSLVDLF